MHLRVAFGCGPGAAWRTIAAMSPLLPSLDPAQPLRLVLDTNVVMALWHFADPKLTPLADFIAAGRAVLFTREDCLGELRRVLAYVQFAIPPERQARLHAAYAARVRCLPPADEAQLAVAATLPRCRDRDDQKFVTLAWDAGADVLVTRDKLLLGLARKAPLRGRLAILTPERLQQALTVGPQEAAGLKSEECAP